jgi:ABC-type transport system involved in multi-copper enzyme maturation permease subunit
MIFHLFLKEIRLILLRARFASILAAIIILFATYGFIFARGFQERQERYATNIEFQSQTIEGAAKRSVASVAMRNLPYYLRPAALTFLNSGNEKYLPNVLNGSAFRRRSLESQGAGNPILPDYSDPDWIFLAGVIISFLAVVLLFGAISREKENGSLKMLLSYSTNRWRLFLAKYLAGLVTLTVPLFMGACFFLAIVMILAPTAQPEAYEWGSLLISFAVLVIYLSVFVLVGLLMSTITRSSAVSLIACLGLWFLFVLLIPSMGGPLGRLLHKAPSSFEFRSRIPTAREEIDSGRWPNDSLMHDSSNPHHPSHRNRARFLKQVRAGLSLTRISPFVLVRGITERLSGTGLYHVLKFQDQYEIYKDQLLAWAKDKDRQDPDSPHWISPESDVSWSKKPVDPADMPRFIEQPVSLAARLNESLFDITALIAMNLLLFLAGFTAFNFYDPR